jgi:hypothetical protein
MYVGFWILNLHHTQLHCTASHVGFLIVYSTCFNLDHIVDTNFANEFIAKFEISLYISQLYDITSYFFYVLIMAVSTAETRSCSQSLQFVWCWRILCWFYLIVNKTGMGNHHKIVFTVNSSQRDPKFNLCLTPSPLDPKSVWVLCQESALEGNTILTKLKRILQGDSKVYKHMVWSKKHTKKYGMVPACALVRSAVSRSLDWSPRSRGEATKVPKPHPTWVFTCGGIWRPWCNRWKYKMLKT